MPSPLRVKESGCEVGTKVNVRMEERRATLGTDLKGRRWRIGSLGQIPRADRFQRGAGCVHGQRNTASRRDRSRSPGTASREKKACLT